MNSDQVADLAEHAHVYMTKDGRISMAGLNEHNIQVRILSTMRNGLIIGTLSTLPKACQRRLRENLGHLNRHSELGIDLYMYT